LGNLGVRLAGIPQTQLRGERPQKFLARGRCKPLKTFILKRH
jgi:hypothetical protein